MSTTLEDVRSMLFGGDQRRRVDLIHTSDGEYISVNDRVTARCWNRRDAEGIAHAIAVAGGCAVHQSRMS